MDTAMDMSGYNIERDALMTEQYGEEVMCAGWNPQLTLLGEDSLARIKRHVNVIADWASMDADAFLKRVYECQ